MDYYNEILQPVAANLTWTNCTIILSLKDINEIMYYWNECEKDNKLVLEYSSDSRIFSTTYILN